jgi:hypothetical protein
MAHTGSSSVSPAESGLTSLLIILLIVAAVRDLARPTALSVSAHRTQFSVQRVLADLKFIAARPHSYSSLVALLALLHD